MRKVTYTLCFDLDITFDHSEWDNREIFRKQIEHQLAMAIDGKVEVGFVEQQRSVVTDSTENK